MHLLRLVAVAPLLTSAVSAAVVAGAVAARATSSKKCTTYTTYTETTTGTQTVTSTKVTGTTTGTRPFSTKYVVTKKTLTTKYTADVDTLYTVSKTVTKATTFTVGHTKVIPKSCPSSTCSKPTTRATTVTVAAATPKKTTTVISRAATVSKYETVGVVTKTTTSGSKTVVVKSTVTQSTVTSTVYTDTAYRAKSTSYLGYDTTTTATRVATAASATATVTRTVFSLEIVDSSIDADGYTIGIASAVGPFGRNAVSQDGQLWQYYVEPNSTSLFEYSTGLRLYRDADFCDGCYLHPNYFLPDGVEEYQDGAGVQGVTGCKFTCGGTFECDIDNPGLDDGPFGIEYYGLGAQIGEPEDFVLNLKAVQPTTGR